MVFVSVTARVLVRVKVRVLVRVMVMVFIRSRLRSLRVGFRYLKVSWLDLRLGI